MSRLSRRDFLKTASLAIGLSWPSPSTGETAPGQDGPNIVFILADDLGWMDTAPYGSTYYDTPNLKRLAARGMLFTNAYAASPLCSPTRASIMTGKYPARLGITTPSCHLPALDPAKPLLADKAPSHQKMITPESRRFLPPEEYTIGEAFRDAGYHTGFIGKWHLGLDEEYWPRNQGFEYDLGAPNPGPPSYLSPYRFKTISDGPPGEYITDRITDETLRYLDAHKGEPFMLCLWHFAVHAPFQAKESITAEYRAKKDPRGRQDCAVMASMVKSLDESVGRVLDKLDALNLADNTIIIFMSDNGGNMYDEVDGTTPTNNWPLRGGKGNSYEGGTREPCIIVWPGMVKPGARCDEIISSVDFYPTMLEMAGISRRPGHVIDGVSIVPLLQGTARLDREAIFCHFPHYTPATANLPCTYVRKGDWKLLRLYGEGPDRTDGYQLYNLAKDVSEQHDVAGRYPDKVAELSRLIDRFLADTGALVPVKNPAYKAPVRGWQASADCLLAQTETGMHIESTGNDPYIYCHDVRHVTGRLMLVLRMRSSLGGAGLVFWADLQDRNFSAKQRIAFDPIHDGRWHDYEIPFASVKPLLAVRIDPGVGKGAADIASVTLRRPWGEVLNRWRESLAERGET